MSVVITTCTTFSQVKSFIMSLNPAVIVFFFWKPKIGPVETRPTSWHQPCFMPLRQTETHFCSPKVISPEGLNHGHCRGKSATISWSCASDWSQEWSYLPHLLICHTTTMVCAASLGKLDMINCDLNPALAEKGVVASVKSRLYSSFALSCRQNSSDRNVFSLLLSNTRLCPSVRIMKRSDNQSSVNPLNLVCWQCFLVDLLNLSAIINS